MPVEEEILQGVRAVLQASRSPALTDDQVVPADDKGTRPPLPYLTVAVIVPGVTIGEPEVVLGESGANATEKVAVEKRATVSIMGYGVTAGEWLADLPLALRTDAIWRLARETHALALRPVGAPSRIPRLLETEIEARYRLDLFADFRQETVPALLPEATIVEIDYTLEGGEDLDLDLTL